MPSHEDNGNQAQELLTEFKGSKIGSAKARALRACLKALLYLCRREVRNGKIVKRTKKEARKKK